MYVQFYDLHKRSKTICENSAFHKHYWAMRMDKENKTIKDNNEVITNDYYVKDFGRYLVKTFLTFAPMFSAIMLP